MSPESYQRVRRLFNEAIEHPENAKGSQENSQKK
jgi:hypothetical protein